MRTNFAEIYKNTSQDQPQENQDTVISTFLEQNKYLKYFIDNTEDTTKIQNLYTSCYHSIKSYFVKNKIEIPFDFSLYIYKMIFLFQDKSLAPLSTLENFDKFAKSFINTDEQLKDFLSSYDYDSFDFPRNTNYAKFSYDVNAMRTALKKIGYPILKNFENLSEIQKANQSNFPKDLKEFKPAALKAKFLSPEKNIKLSELCNYYDGNNDQFQTILTLMDNNTLPSIEEKGNKILAPKPIDNLPNIIAKYTNPNTKSQYHVVKLPSNDFRALMLGNITGNCQTIGNFDADTFIIDGITRPNNGFYVIIKQSKKSFDTTSINSDSLKKDGKEIIDQSHVGKKPFNPMSINWDSLEKDGHEIIGQSYAWIGRDEKTITWEAPILIKDRAKNIDIKEIFTAFGEAVAKEGFDRVTIGLHDLGFKGAESKYSETIGHNIIMEGSRYYFSSNGQYEVYASERLTEIRKQLSTIIGNEYNINSITSVLQGQILVNFLQDKSFDLSIMEILISPYLTKNWDIEKIGSILSSINSASPEQLELILNKDMQIFYKYGMTIEYALKMPPSVLSLLTSLLSHSSNHESSFLTSGINIDELVEKIISVTSVDPLNIKTVDPLNIKIVKLMAKQLCNDTGDLGYIDAMLPSKIDFLVKDNLGIDLLYKKYYTIETINALNDEKLTTLKTNYQLVEKISNNEGISINSFVDRYNSALTLKQVIMKFAIQMFNKKNQDNLTCEDNIINNLSSEKLDFFLSQLKYLSYESRGGQNEDFQLTKNSIVKSLSELQSNDDTLHSVNEYDEQAHYYDTQLTGDTTQPL